MPSYYPETHVNRIEELEVVYQDAKDVHITTRVIEDRDGYAAATEYPNPGIGPEMLKELFVKGVLIKNHETGYLYQPTAMREVSGTVYLDYVYWEVDDQDIVTVKNHSVCSCDV